MLISVRTMYRDIGYTIPCMVSYIKEWDGLKARYHFITVPLRWGNDGLLNDIPRGKWT